MSEYEELREDIGAVAKAVEGYSATAVSHLLEQSRQIDKLWKDNGELRDELYAVANRLENLTRAVTTSPAEVAAAIVTDANRSTLRQLRYPDGTMDCPMCGGGGGLNVVQGDEIAQVQCERCEGFGRVRDQVRHG